MSSDKQLIVPEAPESSRPVIVFNQLTDAQFSQALAAFAPEPRSKPNLWQKPAYTGKLMKCAAYCESVPAMRPKGGIFASKSIENSFDSAMIEKFKPQESDEFFFSVSEWYNDSIGEIPEALKTWDPYKDFELMPEYTTGVDWLSLLTDMDLRFPGFLDLLTNFIDLDEQLQEEVNKRKHGASTRFGTGGLTATTSMPDSINDAAKFNEFTPSALLKKGAWTAK